MSDKPIVKYSLGKEHTGISIGSKAMIYVVESPELSECYVNTGLVISVRPCGEFETSKYLFIPERINDF